MDKNETDFDALLAGTSAQEAKRLWRVLSDWCEGDENSFPVHLALLTRAQWRAAARIPPLVNDSVKLMEHKLAEYRLQTGALVNDLARTAGAQAKDLEDIVAKHSDAMNQAVARAQARLKDAEFVAENIKSQLESGALEWKKAKSEFEVERQKLEQARKDLDARLKWRDRLWLAGIMILLIGLGIVLGICIAH
jgi:hypothetical protein